MNKYYVDSGNRKFVCSAKDCMEAIQKALQAWKRPGTRLDEYIRVNQQGCDDIEHVSDEYFPTMFVIQQGLFRGFEK